MANRYPVWHPLGPALRSVLTLAVAKGTVTTSDINRLVPNRPGRPAWRLAGNWVERGWLEHTDVQGVYRPTRKAIERMAEVDHHKLGGFNPIGGAIERVHALIRRRGAVSCKMIAELLQITRESARVVACKWVRRGVLRRTHRDTYRLPAAQVMHRSHGITGAHDCLVDSSVLNTQQTTE